MHGPFETVTQLNAKAHILRRRAHGVIDIRDGQFQRVLLRPFPKLISLPEVWLLGHRHHERRLGDRFMLYYDQPWRTPNFLAFRYAVSSRRTSYQSLRRALDVLDEIARLKKTDALVCEVTNDRISPRILARWGWEPHCEHRQGRHFIKRFYGEYPTPAAWIAKS